MPSDSVSNGFANLIKESAGDVSTATSPGLLLLSRGTAIILFVVYLAYLYFQLKSHSDLFIADEDDEEEKAQMGLWTAGISLAVITLVTSFCAGMSRFLLPSFACFSDLPLAH
jgi:Ca2+:H+ antiporter